MAAGALSRTALLTRGILIRLADCAPDRVRRSTSATGDRGRVPHSVQRPLVPQWLHGAPNLFAEQHRLIGQLDRYPRYLKIATLRADVMADRGSVFGRVQSWQPSSVKGI